MMTSPGWWQPSCLEVPYHDDRWEAANALQAVVWKSLLERIPLLFFVLVWVKCVEWLGLHVLWCQLGYRVRVDKRQKRLVIVSFFPLADCHCKTFQCPARNYSIIYSSEVRVLGPCYVCKLSTMLVWVFSVYSDFLPHSKNNNNAKAKESGKGSLVR